MKEKAEKEIIRKLLKILHKRSVQGQTNKRWRCKSCFQRFQKKSYATRHFFAAHCDTEWSKLKSVKEFNCDKFLEAYYEYKDESVNDQKFIDKVAKRYIKSQQARVIPFLNYNMAHMVWVL